MSKLIIVSARIPFCGFYNSYLDGAIDSAIECNIPDGEDAEAYPTALITITLAFVKT